MMIHFWRYQDLTPFLIGRECVYVVCARWGTVPQCAQRKARKSGKSLVHKTVDGNISCWFITYLNTIQSRANIEKKYGKSLKWETFARTYIRKVMEDSMFCLMKLFLRYLRTWVSKTLLNAPKFQNDFEAFVIQNHYGAKLMPVWR